MVGGVPIAYVIVHLGSCKTGKRCLAIVYKTKENECTGKNSKEYDDHLL